MNDRAEDGERSPAALLERIQRAVAADRSPSGFEATVAIGVDDSWLVVECGARATCTTVRTRPSANAVLALSAEQANAVVTGAPIPDPASAVFAGDDAILKQFVARYLTRRSMLSIRATK